MQENTTLLLKIAIGPDVMIARKEVDIDSHVCQLGYLTEETGVAFGDYILVFIPKVKHIAQQINGTCLMLDAVKEAHQPPLLHPGMRDGKRTQMGI
jgi:hypothetical protein